MSQIRLYQTSLAYNFTRDALETALNADNVEVFFAIRLFFDSGELNLWTGLGDKVIDGITYVGTGQILSIPSVTETAEIAAAGVDLELSGIPSSLVSLALSEAYQGRTCTIYFGVGFDNPIMIEIFTGFMDSMTIAEGPETSVISLSVENKLVNLERPNNARFTSAYQKSIYPGDLGFDFVEDLQDKRINWGRW